MVHDFLSRLRANIDAVERIKDDLNRALRGSVFMGEVYQIRQERDQDKETIRYLIDRPDIVAPKATALMQSNPGQRLTLLPFFVKAISAALEDFLQMNAHFEPERDVVVRYDAFHAGIATQTADGLMVPVLRDADRMPLRKMANAIARLTSAARDGNAKRDELIASTLTITSLGELGGLVTTPVLNLPEVAIIGVNKIAIRPVWTGMNFVPRRVMNLSSSFDHRVTDGQDVALFVRWIKSLLEEPATMFIEA